MATTASTTTSTARPNPPLQDATTRQLAEEVYARYQAAHKAWADALYAHGSPSPEVAATLRARETWRRAYEALEDVAREAERA